jgi:hypothetical protein
MENPACPSLTPNIVQMNGRCAEGNADNARPSLAAGGDLSHPQSTIDGSDVLMLSACIRSMQHEALGVSAAGVFALTPIDNFAVFNQSPVRAQPTDNPVSIQWHALTVPNRRG